MRPPRYLAVFVIGGVLGFSAAAAAQPSGRKPSAPARSAAQVDREWDKLLQAASRLALEDKPAEALALSQKFLARHPNHADAHYLVARLYEQLAAPQLPQTPESRRHLENAATHYARAAELSPDASMRFVLTWKLATLYAADELDQPIEAERYARRLVDEHPARAESHMVYARLLRDRDEIAAAADVLRKGRVAAAMPVPGLMLLMQYAMEQVQASRDVPPAVAGTLLGEAVASADAILAQPDKDERDYRLATMGKAMALELQAERVETDRGRRLALLVESERWGAPIAEHKDGAPPAARALSAEDAADLEWQYVRRWNARLADDGRVTEAVAAYEQYLRGRPKYAPAHAQLAELFVRAARDASDAETRTRHLEKAVAELQQVVDVADTPFDRDAAFSQLVDLYGPAGLDRPGQEEAAARAMVKRHPTAGLGHYTLAALLLGTGRPAEAEKALRGARAAIRPTASSRAAMAGDLLDLVRNRPQLPPGTARRLFDEAGTLLTEAEKLGATDIDVIERRAGWLNLHADQFESDAARAQVSRERAKQLLTQALAQREDADGRANERAQPIEPPAIVKHVPPAYPDAALKARIQGVVVIEATIGPDGKVHDARVLESIPLLDDAALEAVRQWEYAPTLVNGVAVSVIATVRVTFSLSPPAVKPPPGAGAPVSAPPSTP